MCREEGKALLDLAARSDTPLKGFGIFGIVKETGVDDEGLRTFQKDYFNRQLYKNDSMEFYQALGNRKVGLRTFWNFFKQRKALGKRMKSKNIEGNMKGEGLRQGGVIIFDKNGVPKFAYEEITGQELPVEDIAAAVKAVKEGN